MILVTNKDYLKDFVNDLKSKHSLRFFNLDNTSNYICVDPYSNYIPQFETLKELYHYFLNEFLYNSTKRHELTIIDSKNYIKNVKYIDEVDDCFLFNNRDNDLLKIYFKAKCYNVDYERTGE